MRRTHKENEVNEEYRKNLIDINKQLDDTIESKLRRDPHPAVLMVVVAIVIAIAFMCIEVYPDQTIGRLINAGYRNELRYQPPPARSWHWSQDGGQISVYRGESISVVITEECLSIWLEE